MLEVATNPDKDKSWMKRIRENQWKQIYPAVSSSSSVTEFNNHISAAHTRSIMTNYDYTQYDASSSMMKEDLRAALASSELIDDNNSILDNSGCGIHKSSWPVDEEEEDGAKVKANIILAPNTPRTSGDTESKCAASSPNNTLDIDTTLTKSSTKASQKSKKSSGSKILRLFFRGKKSNRSTSKKGGAIAAASSTPDTPDTDASSRKLDDCSPLPHNDTLASDVTPTATDSSFIQGRSSFAEPPIIPLISSPHIPPRKERVHQQQRVNDLSRKISAREDEMSKDATSQDTARMTDDDTSDGGEVNSTAATREPKEGYNSEDCPIDDDDNDAAKHIFVENVVNYNSFFSGSGCTNVATEVDSKDEDEDGIKSKQAPALSTKYNDTSVCDDESNMNDVASFDDTLDSIDHTCDPCGVVGELMADVSEAIHDLIDLLKPKQQPIARKKKKNESIGSRCSNTRKSRSSSRRQSTVYRIDHDVNIQQRRRLT